MNKQERNRHSVNCYFCSKELDERECASADQWNDNDGGSICPVCQAKREQPEVSNEGGERMRIKIGSKEHIEGRIEHAKDMIEQYQEYLKRAELDLKELNDTIRRAAQLKRQEYVKSR